MEQIVQSYVNSRDFMGTVLVASDRMVLDKGYGMANLEWEIPNAPNVRFRLGSITKQFTAVSILLLEERGALRLDDPVKKYLPDAPRAWDRVTIFHLLTHTSGIPSFTDMAEYDEMQRTPTTPEKLLASFRNRPLAFEPGTKWEYSNSGYAVLGYLIEKISGHPYAQFLEENLFFPLNMRDTGYDSNSRIIARRASGYERGRDGWENAGYLDMTVPFSAGGLYSTSEDLLRWEQALFGGLVLRPKELEEMTTPYKEHYGFGLEINERGGKKVIEHSGGINGFSTMMAYYPDDKLIVIALSNVMGDAAGKIAWKLAAVMHGEKVRMPAERKEIALTGAALSKYAGTYAFADGRRMAVSMRDKTLYTKLGEQRAIPIFAETDRLFFARVVDAEIEFETDAGGKVTGLILHQNGFDQRAALTAQ